MTKPTNPGQGADPRSGDTPKGEQVSCEEHREALLDDALDDSFPASDPPAITRQKFKPC